MQLGNATGIPEVPTIDTLDISLRDVWDTVNPLEHIPFISTLYDAMTGSNPSAGAQLAGGVLYGGPIGLVFSAINVVFEGETGRDAVGTMIAALTGQDTPPQFAAASDAYQKAQTLGTSDPISVLQ